MAITYRIKDWDLLYETSETRKLKHLTWVPMPNKHDGKGYRRLMRTGIANYAAWLLMVQVASKCPQRGLLEDQDGPLTPADLSVKTDCPEECFLDAIPKLLQVGWLEALNGDGLPAELPASPGESAGVPGDSAVGREGKGREQKGLEETLGEGKDPFLGEVVSRKRLSKAFVKPSAEDVQAFLDSLGETRFSGTDFVNANETKGWLVGTTKTPMVSWKHAVQTWISKRNRQGEPQLAKKAPNPATPNALDTEIRAARDRKECPKCHGPNPLGLDECRSCFALGHPNVSAEEVDLIFSEAS